MEKILYTKIAYTIFSEQRNIKNKKQARVDTIYITVCNHTMANLLSA